MRYTQETGEILQKKEIAPGIYDITVNLPKIAKAASVGQFVNIYCGGFTLRRPISLCGFDQKLGTVRLVFEVRGEGTKCLAEYSAGDMLDVVGPLGHGFSMTDSAKKAVIVGGALAPRRFAGCGILPAERSGDNRFSHRVGGNPSAGLPPQEQRPYSAPTTAPPAITVLPLRRLRNI